MSQSNFGQFLSKKAYEISYALFRMAAVVRRPSFADSMESRGLSLLDAAVAEDCKRVKIIARGVEYLLRFGADVGALSQANVEVVVKELAALNSAIAEFEKSASVMPVTELNDIFSKLPLPFTKEGNRRGLSGTEGQNKPLAGETGVVDKDRDQRRNSCNSGGNGNHGLVKSAMRQSAILERIRQSGNLPDGKVGCRLRGIQEFLPEISERTLRYDIQSLIGQGFVERVGNGGPATYYKIKEIAASPENHQVLS